MADPEYSKNSDKADIEVEILVGFKNHGRKISLQIGADRERITEKVRELYTDMELPSQFFLKYFDKDWNQWVDISGNFKLEGKIKIEIVEEGSVNKPCSSKDSPGSEAKHKLAAVMENLRGALRAPKQNAVGQQERKKKSVVKVQLGWSNFRSKTRSYSQVKSNSGGGVVNLQVARDIHYTELKNKAIETFFPSGKSKFLGSKENFHFFLGNNRGQAYESDRFSVDDLFQEAGSKARVYLYSKLKSYDPIELSTSGSDEESLPEMCLDAPLPEEPVPLPMLPSTAIASTSQEPAVTTMSLLPAATTSNAGPTRPQETATNISGTPTVSFKASGGICEICADRLKDCFYIPCGHTLCMPCAVQLENEGCPYCKGAVERIGNLFP